MVETNSIRIDEIQKKLRHRYMLLVGLSQRELNLIGLSYLDHPMIK